MARGQKFSLFYFCILGRVHSGVRSWESTHKSFHEMKVYLLQHTHTHTLAADIVVRQTRERY